MISPAVFVTYNTLYVEIAMGQHTLIHLRYQPLFQLHKKRGVMMSDKALIVVDVQNDYFPDGKWPLVGIQTAAENARKVLAHSREQGWTIIHIRHEFPTEEAPFFLPGSEGAAIHDSMAPQDGEPVILKRGINAFLNTDLDTVLKEAGVKDVTIVGNMSHMCIDAATRAAADLGYNVTLIHDACATHDQTFDDKTIPAADVHAAYMAALGFAYAQVISTDDLI